MTRYIPCLLISLLCLMQDGMAQTTQATSDTLWVTIFVHGALTIRPYVTIPNLLRLVRDKIDGTVYKRSLEVIRDDPYIYQTQVMQDRGLLEIDMLDDRPSATATLFALLYNRVLKETYPERSMTRYYTYGWSGLFSHAVRIEESQDFYQQVKNLRADLQSQFPTTNIHITVIGYSHGGNIILGAGKYYRQDIDKSFFFDEVMFIGTPIQQETQYYAWESLFKKIYVFYSCADKAVVLDFFSTKRFFSSRYFHQHGSKPLPAHICQIELRLSDQRISLRKKRRKKIKESFYKLVDCSPGHTELWSFGWIESGFRFDFPLYPLALGTFLPYLKKQAQQHEALGTRHFIEHMYYHTKTMTISPRFSFKQHTLPFLSAEFINELQELTEARRPKNFHRRDYEARFNQVIDRVKAEKICERKENAKRNLCRRRFLNEQPTKCLL